MNIKPCPFCGEEAGPSTFPLHENGPTVFRVMCRNGHSMAPAQDSEEDAIKFWNQRTTDGIKLENTVSGTTIYTNAVMEKFMKHVVDDPTPWLAEAKWRSKNRQWLRLSQKIAYKIIQRTKQRGYDIDKIKESFGEELYNDTLKGKANLTLKQITELEECFGIKIIKIRKGI